MITYEIHPENPHKRYIQKAVEALESGQLVIYPTDTVYGLGCSINNKQAIERIYKIKGKSKFTPMSIICSSIRDAAKYARISNFAFRVMKRCFPGPFTVVLEATREIPKLMLTRQKEIGIRIPDNKVVIEIVELLGHPIITSSINIPGEEILNDPEKIIEIYSGKVDLLLDTGPLPEPVPSTVLRIEDNNVEILREGKGDPARINI
ncbi:MAG: L-threonylcarbamoyladenylate synthase [Calditrichia bacterium]